MKLSFLFLSIVSTICFSRFARCEENPIPAIKYECFASVGQDWFGGGHDSVYAVSRPFIVTENDYSKGVLLDQSAFTDFLDTEESDLELSSGETVKTKGHANFTGSDLENGFGLWITIRGNWNHGKFYHLDLETLFSLGTKAKDGTKDRMGFSIDDSQLGRAETLANSGTVRLTSNPHSGPIHLLVKCQDKLPRQP